MGECNAGIAAMVFDRADGVPGDVGPGLCGTPERVATLLAARRHGLGRGLENGRDLVPAGSEDRDRATSATI